MADLPMLSVRVRDQLITDGPEAQVCEILRDGEVLGLLAGVTRAETVVAPVHLGKLILTINCTSETTSVGPIPARPVKPPRPLDSRCGCGPNTTRIECPYHGGAL